MSFNWPTIPFTGAEVEAFVTAYKELAESIYDDYVNYTIDPGKLKSPYRYKENIKIFLENGLLYAAFTVKQRAGNSGPGTSFVLGNTPLPQKLNSQQKKKLVEDMGCIFDPEEMKKSYNENNQNDPDGDDPNCNDAFIITQQGVRITVCDIIDDLTGSDDDGDDGDNGDDGDDGDDGDENKDTRNKCEDFWNNLRSGFASAQGLPEGTAEEPNCFAKVLPILISLIARSDMGLSIMYSNLVYYLQGTGGIVNNGILDSYAGNGASSYLRERVRDLMTRPKGSHIFSGYSINLTNINGVPASSSIYGVSGGRVYTVDSADDIRFPTLKNILGGFTVVTDGTEVLSIDNTVPSGQWDTTTGKAYFTSLNSSSIKQIRDDYDFDDYGWKLVRSLIDNDIPGEQFNDSQLESGFLYTNSTTSPCEAVSQGGYSGKDLISGTSRWIVANTHGTGRKEQGEYYNPSKPCQAKPFAIKLSF